MKKFLLALALLIGGQAFAAGTVLKTIGDYSYQNYLINSAMDYNHRITSTAWGTGGSTATANVSCATGTRSMVADRWYVCRNSSTSGRMVNRAITTGELPFDALGITQVARVGRLAGATDTASIYMGQDIETLNARGLRGKTVTLKFYYRMGSGFTGTTLNATLASGTGVDETFRGSPTGYVGSTATTLTPTTSWTIGSKTWAVPATANEAYVFLSYTPSAGASGNEDWFEATGFMLNEGATAAPFRLAGGTIGGELALVQRYTYSVNPGNTDSQAVLGNGHATSTTAVLIDIPFPVTMRATPTIDPASSTFTSSFCLVEANGDVNACSTAGSLAGNRNGPGGVQLSISKSGGTIAAGQALTLIKNGTTKVLIFSAEL